MINEQPRMPIPKTFTSADEDDEPYDEETSTEQGSAGTENSEADGNAGSEGSTS